MVVDGLFSLTYSYCLSACGAEHILGRATEVVGLYHKRLGQSAASEYLYVLGALRDQSLALERFKVDQLSVTEFTRDNVKIDLRPYRTRGGLSHLNIPSAWVPLAF